MPMPWFRLYSELLTDRKITYTARMTGQSRVVVVGTWAGLLCLANDSPERGTLLLAPGMPYTVEDLAEEVGTDTETCAQLIEAFETLQMLTQNDGVWYITQWQSRQFQSDDSTARVQAWRERKAQKPSGDNVPAEKDETLQQYCENVIPSVSVSVSDSALESESENEGEIEQTSPQRGPNLPIAMQNDNTPAPIRVYREIRRWCPPPGSPPWQLMAELPSDEKSLEKWRQVIAAWWNLDFNGRNIAGQVDWFHKGIPPTGSPREARAKMDFEAAKKEDVERRDRKLAEWKAQHGTQDTS